MILAINKQPGTNTVEVVENIQKLLPEFRREVPASVQFATAFDASTSIRNSIRDVEFTLILTVAW
jgi:HAE1 family hydrophobic/amphiphilic exporter-1